MVVRQPALALLAATVVVGCSGSSTTSESTPPDESPTITTDTTAATVPDTAATTEPTEPTEPTTTAAETTTTTESTASESTTPTSTSPATTQGPEPEPDDASETFDVAATVPTGEFFGDPGALVVLETDGDLTLLPNGLSPGNEAPPIELVDLPDPRQPSSEGPAPNFVDDVAGIIGGSVVYGDCCEPVGGNLFAVPAIGQNQLFGGGANPNLSPDGERLATANSSAITVTAVASGEGFGVLLNQGLDTPFNSITDLEWVDDDTLATLGIVDEEFEFTLWDAATLTELASSRLKGLADLDQARFAGRTPAGMLAVEVTGPDLTTVRMFDGLDENVDARLQFPPTVSGIEIDAARGGITWVDGETLFSLSPGTFEARPLRDDVRSSWFVNAP